MIDKIIQQIKRLLPFLILIWFITTLFFAVDGISRNIYTMDIDFFFKGIYNNRILIFLPLWIILFNHILGKGKTKGIRFLRDNSLILFLLLINILSLMQISNSGTFWFYILKTIVAFLVVASIMPFIEKLLGIFKTYYEGKDLEDIYKKPGLDKVFTKREIIISIGLMIVFCISRFYYLNNLYPTTDEYLHLLEAKSSLSPAGVLYAKEPYTRAFFLTWTLEQLFSYFGFSVALGRIPGVVISCLTVPLFYLLIKKEDKTLAIISTLLYALSPWSIMLSRTIREYIFFIPIYLLVSVYVYRRVNCILNKQYKFKHFLVDIIILGSILFYSFWVDPLSTMKFSLVFYLVGLIYWFFNYIKDKEIGKKLKSLFCNWKFLLISVLFLIVSTLINRFVDLSVYQINILPSFNPAWISYLFFNHEYGVLVISIIFALLGIVAAFKSIKQSKCSNFKVFTAVAFLTILYFFCFHFGRYYRPRYVSIILPSIIVLSGAGITYVKDFLSNELKITKGSLLILILLLINWTYVFYGFLAKGSGYVKVSHEFHESMKLVYDELKDKDDGFVLITTLPEAADWYWDDGITEIFQYSSVDVNNEEYLNQIVNLYSKGYFVIDFRRNSWSGYVFQEDQNYITTGGYELKYVTTIEHYKIFKWER